MPKTRPPGVADVGGETFTVNAMPDVFDGRDLEYRPRLQILPHILDARPDQHAVLMQEGSSCTGHAVAAMINTVLTAGPDPFRASPYMLYSLGRRYDEFDGDEDQGSSLRGALKGWFYHGVLPEDDWPSLDSNIDLDLNTGLAARALRHPLGAFYRVNAFRIDDMQSAINELHAVAVTALIHSGWTRPGRDPDSGRCVITRSDDVNQLGGHAFALVGYNETGFLVQNSWGKEWGVGGFATLPYEDWLISAFDAWVARPGVPLTANLLQKTKVVTTTSGGVSQGPGPDLETLKGHVINLGRDGRLATRGRFISTPAQIERIFQHMNSRHDEWRTSCHSGTGMPQPRRVVLYAPGGLLNEGQGLTTAQAQLNWWLNNRVYPLTFDWQSGLIETFPSQLRDAVGDRLPFGTLGFDLVEQADRLVEKIARTRLGWMWSEMKTSAAAASAPLPRIVDWPPRETVEGSGMATIPGASLVADRLRVYADSVGKELEVHLVGHSAGAIFTAHLLTRLAANDVPVASICWLAPAIRIDEFRKLVQPQLRAGKVERFACFGLSDSLELDDIVGTDRSGIYQKSFLYLVSRALEGKHSAGESETPLLGMQRHVAAHRLRGINSSRVDLIWSPSEEPPASRCSATSHGGLEHDTPTMTSVLLRILGLSEPTTETTFRPYAPLNPSASAPTGEAAGDAQMVEVKQAGEVPVSRMGQSQAPGDQKPA